MPGRECMAMVREALRMGGVERGQIKALTREGGEKGRPRMPPERKGLLGEGGAGRECKGDERGQGIDGGCSKEG